MAGILGNGILSFVYNFLLQVYTFEENPAALSQVAPMPSTLSTLWPEL